MIQNLQQYLSFEKFVKLIACISYKTYHKIIFSLVIVCLFCNYCSNHRLPMLWVLVTGFVIIIYLDIYSIKQTYDFYNNAGESMSGDETLLLARIKFEKKLYSDWNWLIVLIVPTCILPSVIYIIKYPLGFPIKLFAYTALYIIISLCVIGYMQYVNLILMIRDCSLNAEQISMYDRNRPYKTDWIVKLSSITNKQSNLFFLVGSGYIALLYLITFTDFYAVQMSERNSKISVIYLWTIIALGIVVMFPVFSVCSYVYIKKLITKLIDKEILECNNMQNILLKKRKRKKYLEVLQTLNQIKVIMLEKSPVYPQKPFVAYAVSYIIAGLNFVATIQAALSLVKIK